MENSSYNRLSTNRFTLLLILFLSLLNIIIYFPSLGGYFLADDFMHISYFSSVFQKDASLLLNNFHTNWMQAMGTKFYRPLISLSLAFDYLLWGNNAVGFHLSNMIFQIICTILTYFLISKMTTFLGIKESRVVSITTATFFALYPLHAEVVSWMISRVDSVATMFYLAAFLLFLKYKSNEVENATKNKLPTKKISLLTSLICYFCSLLSKEIAVTLPIALSLWVAIFNNNQQKLWQRFIFSIKQTLPYWIILVLYLAIRTAALGTFSGGYMGSIGAALDVSLINRFIKESYWTKLIFPFNDEIFSPHHIFRYLLIGFYIAAAILLIMRLLNRQTYKIPYKLIAYAICWFIICLLPTYQVFDLTSNLQGSRLIYLASIPVCFLFSLLLLPLVKTDYKRTADLSKNQSKLQRSVSFLSTFTCLTILLIFAPIAYINNLTWRCAGDELRELQQDLLNASASLSPNQKLVLINIPYTYKGAHMLYNGTTLDLLCSSQLNRQFNYHPIITLEPVLYGDPDLLNYGRLQRLLQYKGNYVFFAWRRNLFPKNKNRGLKKFFDQFYLPKPHAEQLKKLEIKNTKANQTNIFKTDYSNLIDHDPNKIKLVTVSELSLPSMQESLIELSIKASPLEVGHNQNGWFQLQWLSADPDAVSNQGSLSKFLPIDGKTHRYLFNLNEHKAWLLCNMVSELKVYFSPGSYDLSIENIRFLNATKIIPKLNADYEKGPQEDSSGTYHFSHKQGFLFQYDASQITGVKKVVYEVSKPDFWFEHLENTFTNNQLSDDAVMRKDLPNLKGAFLIPGRDLDTGYFEVRLVALDKEGRIAGLTSYPVCGQVGSP